MDKPEKDIKGSIGGGTAGRGEEESMIDSGHRPRGGRGAAVALLGLLALAGCANGGLDPKVAAAVAKVCAADAKYQPMVVADAPVVEALLAAAGQPIPAGGVATAIAVDQAGVHDAALKACAALTAPVVAAK